MLGKNNMRIDIQVLRAVSIVFVVFYHLQIPFFSNGFLGVDIFFVISGFLIAKLYTGDFLTFYLKRLSRLMPVYFLTLIVFSLLFHFFFVLNDYAAFVEQVLFALPFVSNFYYWTLNSYFSESDFKPLLHFWSLAVEIQFYAIFPLLYYFTKQSIFKTIAIILFSFLLCLFLLGFTPKSAFFFMPLRLWEFYFGVLAFEISRLYMISWSSKIKWILLIFICLSLLYPVKPESSSYIYGHPGLLSFIICSFTFLLLIIKADFKLESFIVRPLFHLGNLSYSIYLWHFPFIFLFFYSPYMGGAFEFDFFKAIMVVVFTIFSSVLSYIYIEKSRLFKFSSVASLLRFYFSTVFLVFIFSFGMLFAKNITASKVEQVLHNTLSDRSVYRCGILKRTLNLGGFSCRISKADSVNKVLLIGDSHADSVKYGLMKFYEKFSFSLYLNIANYSVMSSEFYQDKAISYILGESIGHVVLHDSFGNFDKNLLERFLLIMSNNEVKVSILGVTPEFSGSVVKFYHSNNSSNLDLGLSYYKDLKKVEADYLDVIEMVGSRFVKYIPTYHLFCSDVDCKVGDGEGSSLFFYDSNHLTESGADFLIREVQNEFWF